MPDSYGPHLDPELEKVRGLQRDAMAEQAGRGSTREGMIEAGLRSALQYGLEHQDPDLANLEKALGIELDAGSFLVGMLAATMVIEGVDMIAMIKRPMGRKLFLEYIEKARTARA